MKVHHPVLGELLGVIGASPAPQDDLLIGQLDAKLADLAVRPGLDSGDERGGEIAEPFVGTWHVPGPCSET